MPKPAQHPDETSLLKELKDLRRRVQALEGQTRLESASIGRGGVTIRDGGELKVVDDKGQIIGWIGYTDTASDPEGHPQSGFVFYAEDRNIPGRQAIPKLSLLDWGVPVGMPERPYVQSFTVMDTNAQFVFQDDPYYGGLNKPTFNMTVVEGGDVRNSNWANEVKYFVPNTYRTRVSRGAPTSGSEYSWFPAYTIKGYRNHGRLHLSFGLQKFGSIGNCQWDIVVNAPYDGLDNLHRDFGSFSDSMNVQREIDLDAIGVLPEMFYNVKIRVLQETNATSANNVSVWLEGAQEVGSVFYS